MNGMRKNHLFNARQDCAMHSSCVLAAREQMGAAKVVILDCINFKKVHHSRIVSTTMKE
jgi:hypothetical protein